MIRELSSKSIKKILEGHPENILVEMQDEIERLKTVKESRVAHGSLLLLVSLSSICQSKDLKSQVCEDDCQVCYLLISDISGSPCIGLVASISLRWRSSSGPSSGHWPVGPSLLETGTKCNLEH